MKFGVIVDVEASRAIRQAEVGAAKTMIDRTELRFGVKLERLAADTAYGSATTLNWLVNDKKIAPHIAVIDKSKREDGTLSREDLTFDKQRNAYVCPAGNLLTTTGTVGPDHTLRYFALKSACEACPLKSKCCSKTLSRKVTRDVHEDARDVARALAGTEAFEESRHDRKRVEMLFAHLKRILRLGRLRLRGPRGAQDEFTLAYPMVKPGVPVGTSVPQTPFPADGSEEVPPCPYDHEIYRIAYTLWEEYGSQAPLIAAKGAAAKKESGDAVEQLVWTAVLNAMLEWMRTERRPDEQLN